MNTKIYVRLECWIENCKKLKKKKNFKIFTLKIQKAKLGEEIDWQLKILKNYTWLASMYVYANSYDYNGQQFIW